MLNDVHHSAPATGDDRPDARADDATRRCRGRRLDQRRLSPQSGDAVVDLREAIRAKLAYAHRQDPRDRPRARLVRGHRAGAARPDRRRAGMAARRESVPNKRVYYLSLEFLIGRLLFDALNNLGLIETDARGAARARRRPRRPAGAEPDAALGNGGLGRLAACFMESMASLDIPAYRLRHPLRPRPVPPDHQGRLAAGAPGELARLGNPWEFERPEVDLHDRLRRHRRPVVPRIGGRDPP